MDTTIWLFICLAVGIWIGVRKYRKQAGSIGDVRECPDEEGGNKDYGSNESSWDPGERILDDVYSDLQIDDVWSVRGAREFRWWGHKQCQTVWAEKTEVYEGVRNCTLHAETDLLVDVPDSDELHGLISVSNAYSTLSALVYDPDGGRLTYRCSVFVHAQIERWMGPLFTNSVAIQAADSYLRAEHLRKTFGGTVAESPHPSSGGRPNPDGMLEVVNDVFAPRGQDEPAWSEEEFQAVAKMDSPSVVTTSSETGLAAEFPFGDSGTALYQSTTTEPHPQMGNGCLCRLSLPIEADDPSMVNKLNTMELEGNSLCPVIGSWVQHRSTLTHVVFLPNAVHVPGLLSLFYLRSALRARWASEVLPDLM